MPRFDKTGSIPPHIDLDTPEGQLQKDRYLAEKGSLDSKTEQYEGAVTSKLPGAFTGAVVGLFSANKRTAVQALTKLVTTAFEAAVTIGDRADHEAKVENFMNRAWHGAAPSSAGGKTPSVSTASIPRSWFGGGNRADADGLTRHI